MRHTTSAWYAVACIFVAMVAVPTTTARAGVTLRYAVDQSHYAVAPGQSVDVEVKLVEERQSAEDASIIVTDDGLIGFDLAVTRLSGTSVITGASPSTDQFSLLLLSGNNPDPLPAEGGTIVEFFVSALDSPGPTGVQNGLLRELVLGTVTITAPMDGLSTFSVADSITFGSNTVTNFGLALDSQIEGASFTVGVPEPGRSAVMALGASLFALRAKRSQRERSLAASRLHL